MANRFSNNRTVTITGVIPNELHRRYQDWCIRHNVSSREMLGELVRRHMDEQDELEAEIADAQKKALPKFAVRVRTK